MSKIKLFINDKEVVLGKNDNVLLNKTKNDYTNPTIIKNSFSKSIKLPRTPQNEAAFDGLSEIERMQTSNTFNPSKRVPFKLYDDSGLFEEGYIKVTNITLKEIEIMLYGQLGAILYTLQKKNEGTVDEAPMTLGDLIYEQRLDFTPTSYMVSNAWTSLKYSYDDIYQTINFIFSAEGSPSSFEMFEPKKAMAYCKDWGGFQMIRNNVDNTYIPYYGPDDFYSFTMDGSVYRDEGSAYDIGTLPPYITSGRVWPHWGCLPYDVQIPQSASVISHYKTSPKGYGLIEAGDDLGFLETRDLRAYLLRPVLRIKKILEAIDRYIYVNSGYHIDFSDDFFQSDDYNNSWVTLPRLSDIDANVNSQYAMTQEKLLGESNTPADYLISLLKTFCLFIDTDYDEKKIILRSKYNFYIDNIVKINEDLTTYKIVPITFDKARYIFDWSAGEGRCYSKYKDDYSKDGYDRKYGSYRVTTGWEFDNDEKQYIENNVFKGACTTLNQSKYYRHLGNCMPVMLPDDIYNGIEDINYTLFQYSIWGGEWSSSNDFKISKQWSGKGWGGIPLYNRGYFYGSYLKIGVYNNSLPILEFCDKDNGEVDGRDVLCKFYGFGDCSTSYMYDSTNNRWEEEATKMPFILTDDITTEMPIALGESGKSCWIQQRSGANGFKVVNEVPVFSKMHIVDGEIDEVVDYGLSKELYVPNSHYTTDCKTFYNYYWKNMIEDMYNVNNKVLKMKMYIDNIDISFRTIYWFNNSLFILNKVSDFSLDEMFAEVELIKIVDMDNYTQR